MRPSRALWRFVSLAACAHALPAAETAPAPASPAPAAAAAAPAAASAAATTPAKKSESAWVFSLLPQSLQKNPRLELTVVTEMTAAGKKRPPATAEAPVYFELFTTGPKDIGHVPGNGTKIKAEEVEHTLVRSLASSHFLPARPPAQRPSIAILYTWGSHYLLTEGDEENPVLSGNELARNLLDRAALVGGEKFARELLQLFQEADAMALTANAHLAPGGEPILTPEMMAFANPVEMFKRRSIKNEMLVDQSASDVYYVVASAYDYGAMAANQRVLLWRTRMTVAAAGVSAEQSLPTLVLSAGPYFGQDMPEPEFISKRALRDAEVKIGPTTVVESDVKTAPPPPPAKK